MTKKSKLIMLIISLIIVISGGITLTLILTDGYTKEDRARLNAVKTHIDNVLKNGRSKKEGARTPLLADGINTFDGSFASWYNYDGTTSPISNFASQQNFMRSLVAYSIVSGDDEYHEEAKTITRYFMKYYQHQYNLFKWGGHQFINIDTLKVEGPQSKNQVHELKNHYPFYDLMIEVDQEAVEKFLAQLWTAHVLVWEKMDFSRHGDYSTPISYTSKSVFEKQVPAEPIVDVTKVKVRESGGVSYTALELPVSNGLSFINAGSDLYYAGYLLSELTDHPNPRAWGKYLITQYNLARNPVTGLPVYQISQPRQDAVTNDPLDTNSKYGDRAKRQFEDDFGPVALEGNVLFKNISSIMIDSMLINFYIGERFNDEDVINWSIDTIKDYYSQALTYDNENRIRLLPMWNDGQTMLGYTFKKSGYYGMAGDSIGYINVSSEHLLPIGRAIRLNPDDEELWEIFREIAKGLGYCDVGTIDGKNEALNLKPLDDQGDPINNAYGMLAFVELFEATGNKKYLELARNIGNEIVATKFNRGYFTKGPEYIYSRIDDIEVLALLTLDASIRGKFDKIPTYLSDAGYVHGEYLDPFTGEPVESGYDTDYIYTQKRFE